MIFKVLYDIKGTRMHEVVVPDDVQLPANWKEMHFTEKDEWIYAHETSSRVIFEDVSDGVAVDIREIP